MTSASRIPRSRIAIAAGTCLACIHYTYRFAENQIGGHCNLTRLKHAHTQTACCLYQYRNTNQEDLRQ